MVLKLHYFGQNFLQEVPLDILFCGLHFYFKILLQHPWTSTVKQMSERAQSILQKYSEAVKSAFCSGRE